MDTVKVEQVIICTMNRRGNGTTDPIRVLTEVFTLDGEKIAEHDPQETKKLFIPSLESKLDKIRLEKYLKCRPIFFKMLSEMKEAKDDLRVGLQVDYPRMKQFEEAIKEAEELNL